MDIVIVGGGTAGWLAALFLSKITQHNLTLIESPTIGIIGAGEGSTGRLGSVIENYIYNFGCDLKDFFKKTNATLKYGVLHRDWAEKGASYFGPIDGSTTSNWNPDTSFLYLLGTGSAPLTRCSRFGCLKEDNLSLFQKNDLDRLYLPGPALHFDARLVGEYFKAQCSERVHLVQSTILDIGLSEQGHIASLTLSEGQTVHGDFFIDASGFSRVLINKMGGQWVDFSKNLPVNTAMPFFVDYKEGEEPPLYTTAWAQSSGWMWDIPLANRRGCGYVFCDEFLSQDQAQQEIETVLGQKISPLKFIKFTSGRLENVWIKNCLALGLSAAFLEPLEATSIHATIIQLEHFVFDFLQETLEHTLNPGATARYNARIAELIDGTKDFLVAHYVGGREDSEFWRYMSSGATTTEFVDDILQMCATMIPGIDDFSKTMGGANWSLWSYVLVGTRILKSEVGASFLRKHPIIRERGEKALNEWLAEYGRTKHQLYENCKVRRLVESNFSTWGLFHGASPSLA